MKHMLLTVASWCKGRSTGKYEAAVRLANGGDLNDYTFD